MNIEDAPFGPVSYMGLYATFTDTSKNPDLSAVEKN